MKLANLGKILGVAALLVATAAIAADLGIKVTTQKASWRYKMTVEVETPEGIKTGSAVREVTVVKPTPEIQGLYDTKVTVDGEAVVVDLGKRGILFALLSGYDMGPDNAYQVVFNSLSGPPGLSEEGIEYYKNLKNIKATLKPENYPFLVTFLDKKNPKTIKMIHEMKWDGTYPMHYKIFADHSEEIFGKGVHVKDIKIEMTNEPVTKIIDKYMPSYSQDSDFWSWLNSLAYDDPRRVGPSSFK